jgi:hypothetical protein
MINRGKSFTYPGAIRLPDRLLHYSDLVPCTLIDSNIQKSPFIPNAHSI